jgi:hypothetical protein
MNRRENTPSELAQTSSARFMGLQGRKSSRVEPLETAPGQSAAGGGRGGTTADSQLAIFFFR